LSDFKVYAPAHPDLTCVRTSCGDYHEGDLSRAMNKDVLVADTVQTWLKQADWRPTLCYAVDRLHAKHLQQQFQAAGVPCGYQDAYTKDAERKQIKKDFHAGALKVVCNVGTLTTGIDWDVRCISLVRPTKSQMLFVQIIGRGLRTANDKDHCLILDHSDNHLRLGFVTDIDASHTELLSGKTPVSDTKDRIRLPKECPKCAFLKAPGTARCPVCGFVAIAHSKIEPTPGELKELKRKKRDGEPMTMANKLIFFAELKGYAQMHGYKPGWASNKYREKTGVWPDHSIADTSPIRQISAETLSWIKSRAIAWAKSQRRLELQEGGHDR
jgi:superfamily II DNA or RNA helicase